MNNLIIGGLVYNEEYKFLHQWLENNSKLSNKIVIIDDGSTDNSLTICSKYTSYISQTNNLMNKNESLLRKTLWDKCIELANNGDYIFISDNDELLTENSLENFEKIINIANSLECDAISYILYDMWNNDYYREDKYWTAHKKLWTHCIKYNKNKNYYWNTNQLHCGRLPINSFNISFPSKLQVKHMGYSTLELRKKKFEFYNNLDPNGIYGIKEQYNSILDKNPNLIKFKDNFEENNE